MELQTTDRPNAIQFAQSRLQMPKRLSLPNTVFIEIPENHNNQQLHNSSRDGLTGSCLWTPHNERSIGLGRRESSQNYVEDTIYYDQFEDRRIDVSKSARSNPGFINRPAPPVPSPDDTSDSLPVEANVTPDDGFRLPPLPVMDIPDPPPAYTEIDEHIDRNIVPPVRPVFSGQPSRDLPRKLIICPCCRMRVYTIVIRESGALTHIIAAIVFFLFLPVIFCIYLTDCCKYKNHYCPNCNQLIGYEIPILCTDMVYTRSSIEHNIEQR